jgi:hypothetical protein
MLEKLATHDIQDVPELFSLVDKCARATEGHAWHTTPVPEAGKESKPNAGAATQGSSSNNNNNNNNNNKKVGGNNQPLAAAPTATAVVAGGGRGPQSDKCLHQEFGSNDGGAQCLVHNSACHSVSECREIKKLAEQLREKQQQSRQEGVPSCQGEGKEKMVPEEEKDEEMVLQNARGR